MVVRGRDSVDTTQNASVRRLGFGQLPASRWTPCDTLNERGDRSRPRTDHALGPRQCTAEINNITPPTEPIAPKAPGLSLGGIHHGSGIGRGDVDVGCGSGSHEARTRRLRRRCFLHEKLSALIRTSCGTESRIPNLRDLESVLVGGFKETGVERGEEMERYEVLLVHSLRLQSRQGPR